MDLLAGNRGDRLFIRRSDAGRQLPGSVGSVPLAVLSQCHRVQPWGLALAITSWLLLLMVLPAQTGDAQIGASQAGASQAAAEGGTRVGEPAVLLELFTSQGCSSCPAADRLLRQLVRSTATGPVVPLAFHVDYWNYLGWNDPFASAQWSKRQRSYARSLALDTVYTPQLVVNGSEHCVGSSLRDAKRLIEEARKKMMPGQLELLARFPDSSRAPGAEQRVVRLSLATQVETEGPTDLMVAVFENRLETDVSSGENSSRVLENDFVVRHLVRHERLDGSGRYRGQLDLALEPGWSVENLGVAAFLQDARSRRVLQATSILPSRAAQEPE